MIPRRLLLVLAASAAAAAPAATPVAAHAATPVSLPVRAAARSDDSAASYAAVMPDTPLHFPQDYGAHPEFRTEWWYITGWLTSADGMPLGFQITFFRTKPDVDAHNPSAFTPHQLLIAHCAISDPERGRLWQDQKIERAGQTLADAAVGDTNVHIDRWSLQREGGVYAARIDAADFSLDLNFTVAQAPLLNGAAGVSRKGPSSQSASYYYSIPHLKVSGTVERNRHAATVSGEAWLDHEWSSEYLDAEAVGWDWAGINLNDGGALMVFRIRDAQGRSRWAGGTLRGADGQVQILDRGDVSFTSQRIWRSPRTAIEYPIAWTVRAGDRSFELQPLLDDQENDTRLSTGAIYWEGAVRAFEQHRLAGLGYLELTGYGERLRLR